MKNTLKRALAFLLAISFFTLASVPSLATAAASTTILKDVKTTAWYYTYVNKLLELNITAGYKDGTYKPSDLVTRAEFVTFLCKAKGYSQAKGDPFTDTQKHWASGYITIALANGIIDLPTDKKFRPDDAITRLEVVEMMCRALNISEDTTTKNPYADVKTNTGYTNVAYANYLMQGSIEKGERYFKPTDKLTRGEVASVIVNTYEYNDDKMAYLNKKIADEKVKATKERSVTNNVMYSVQESIDFVLNKGIVQLGANEKFIANESITAEQYITMLVRTMGKIDVQDYISAATELGIIKDGEFNSYTTKLNRADMAKLTLRVYEKLNNVTYPDYLEAYKTMVTDYKSLKSEEIKQNSLKCVSEGLITVVNGAFKPNDSCTKGLAATAIHHILSEEQRAAVKPVFATVDKEFEAFMADWGNAAKVCSRGQIDRVVDGKILWQTDINGVCLLPTLSNKDSNKEAYESIRTLVEYARKYNHWVEFSYTYGGGDNVLQVFYASSQKAGQLGKGRTTYDFAMLSRYNEDTLIKVYDEPSEKNVQKEKTDYLWKIGCLFNGTKSVYNMTIADYQQKELTEPLKAWLKVIYEPKLASYLADYIIKDDMKKVKYYENKEGEEYTFADLLYPQQFKGLEVQIKRPNILYVGTNKIN